MVSGVGNFWEGDVGFLREKWMSCGVILGWIWLWSEGAGCWKFGWFWGRNWERFARCWRLWIGWNGGGGITEFRGGRRRLSRLLWVLSLGDQKAVKEEWSRGFIKGLDWVERAVDFEIHRREDYWS